MCSQRFPFVVLFFFALLLFCKTNVFASAPQIVAYASDNLTLNQSFTVTATMSGLSKNSLYRLRIALAPQGTTNYFGSTWNGSSWYNGTPSPMNYANFYSLITDGSGAWWGDIQGEIDPDDPNFTTGSGVYDLKIGRYTQTGSTPTWSDIVSVTVVVPPSPTAIPTQIPTPSPLPTHPTPIARLAIATVAPTRIPTATIISKVPVPSTLSPEISTSGAVLGTMSATIPTIGSRPTLVAAQADTRKTEVALLPMLFIITGFGLLASCGILFFFQSERGQMLWKKLL